MPSPAPPKAAARISQLDVLVGGGLVAFNRVAIAAGVRKCPDGWRRAAGLVLRGENATFVLSAFGLKAWSDTHPPGHPTELQTQAHVAHRLATFLEGEHELRIRIKRAPSGDRVEESSSPGYTLRFAPWRERPDRFVPPTDWIDPARAGPDGVDPAEALIHFVGRVAPSGGADLWARVNHVGADGVPIQEMLSRLEAAWGTVPVAFPAPADFQACSIVQSIAGRPDHGILQAFVDFSPLLSWRKRENERLAEPMTFSAAVLWRLAQHPALAGRYMGTTVEVAPTNGLNRGVGVVVIRPSEYLGLPDGLIRYVQDFNVQVDRTRQRASASCKTLDAAALAPTRLAAALLRYGLDQGTTAFGSLGLTVLKDAKVFGTPIGDTGHADGFIAIGSAALPTPDGRRVGCVTVKGPLAKLREYPAILSDLGR